jgi:hypothetical protein
MTMVGLQALVQLPGVVIDDRQISLMWLAAGGTDTVTVTAPGSDPPRIGTVVGLDGAHQALVVANIEHQAWLDLHDRAERVVAAVALAYARR